jgi:hypothetical protein
MKNRMRELRTCGSVRGEGREALTYSDNCSDIAEPPPLTERAMKVLSAMRPEDRM